MTRTTWAVLAAAGMTFAVPVLADDPKVDGSKADGSATASTPAPPAGEARTEVLVEDVRSGAGSMEPADAETQEERTEREFVANVWTSP